MQLCSLLKKTKGYPIGYLMTHLIPILPFDSSQQVQTTDTTAKSPLTPKRDVGAATASATTGALASSTSAATAAPSTVIKKSVRILKLPRTFVGMEGMDSPTATTLAALATAASAGVKKRRDSLRNTSSKNTSPRAPRPKAIVTSGIGGAAELPTSPKTDHSRRRSHADDPNATPAMMRAGSTAASITSVAPTSAAQSVTALAASVIPPRKSRVRVVTLARSVDPNTPGTVRISSQRTASNGAHVRSSSARRAAQAARPTLTRPSLSQVAVVTTSSAAAACLVAPTPAKAVTFSNPLAELTTAFAHCTLSTNSAASTSAISTTPAITPPLSRPSSQAEQTKNSSASAGAGVYIVSPTPSPDPSPSPDHTFSTFAISKPIRARGVAISYTSPSSPTATRTHATSSSSSAPDPTFIDKCQKKLTQVKNQLDLYIWMKNNVTERIKKLTENAAIKELRGILDAIAIEEPDLVQAEKRLTRVLVHAKEQLTLQAQKLRQEPQRRNNNKKT